MLDLQAPSCLRPSAVIDPLDVLKCQWLRRHRLPNGRSRLSQLLAAGRKLKHVQRIQREQAIAKRRIRIEVHRELAIHEVHAVGLFEQPDGGQPLELAPDGALGPVGSELFQKFLGREPVSPLGHRRQNDPQRLAQRARHAPKDRVQVRQLLT